MPLHEAPRVLLACALALGVAAWGGAAMAGPRVSFTLAVPGLILAGSLLLERREGPGLKALALLLIAPALNLHVAQLLVSVDGLPYLAPGRELASLLSVAASTPRAAGPVLAAAGVGALVLGGRAVASLGLACLGGALGARLARLSLQAGYAELQEGRMEGLARDVDVAMAMGSLALLGGLLGLALEPRGLRAGRVGLALSLAASLAAAVTATPPLPELLWSLPSPSSPLALPALAPGLPSLRPTLPDEAGPLGPALLAAGQRRVYPATQPVLTRDAAQWGHQLRAVATFALPAQDSTERLRPLLPELASMGVTRVALVGRAEGPGLTLGEVLSFPAAWGVLEKAPEGARRVRLAEGSWEVLDVRAPGGAGACVAEAERGLSVGALAAALQGLAGPRGPCPGGVALGWLWEEDDAG